MKFKGMKWWVAFCDAMMMLASLPIMIVCFVGLFPCLLVINKRDMGEFAIKRTFMAMFGVLLDLKDALVYAIEQMDELYEN